MKSSKHNNDSNHKRIPIESHGQGPGMSINEFLKRYSEEITNEKSPRYNYIFGEKKIS